MGVGLVGVVAHIPEDDGLQGAPVGWVVVCDSDDSDGRDDDDSLVGWCDDGQSSDDGGDGDDGGEDYRTQSDSR